MYKLYALLATVCFGIAPLCYKLGINKLSNPYQAMLWHNLAAGMTAIILITLRSPTPTTQRIGGGTLLWIALGAILTSCIAQMLYYKALLHGPITNVAIVVACYPVVTLLADMTIHRNKPGSQSVLGLIMIVIGIIMVVNK